MKIPEGTPKDLITRREEVRTKAEEQRRRRDAGEIRALDPRRDLENGALYLGPFFAGSIEELKVIDALIYGRSMRSVWKTLQRRSRSFRKVPGFGPLYGGRTQSLDLLGACMEAKHRWINNPKLTRTQYRELHTRIANKAIELAELLLLNTNDRSLLDVRKYLSPEYFQNLLRALDMETEFGGGTFYLEHAVGEGLPPLPGLLLELHKRATERVELPLSVPQPNSPDAEINHFIRVLSGYFIASHRQPLHATVAAVTAAVFDSHDVDEDKVRALIRADKERVEQNTRRKLEELRRETDG
jgi:hypothetical protein